MTMKINIHDNLFFFLNLSDFLFEMMNLRMHSRISILPLPIQIKTRPRKSIVPMNNPIRIDHRNNIKNKLLFKKQSILIITDKLLDEAFHHMRTYCLTRMNSRRKNYCIFAFFVSYLNQRNLSTFIAFP